MPVDRWGADEWMPLNVEDDQPDAPQPQEGPPLLHLREDPLHVFGPNPAQDLNLGGPKKKGLGLGGVEMPNLTAFADLPVGPLACKLPPFQPKYDTAEEVQMRLRNCLISVKGMPYVVLQVAGGDNIRLKLRNSAGETLYVDFATAKADLRAISPRYLQLGVQAAYVTRLPERKVHQGWHQECNRVTYAGENRLRVMDMPSLLRPLMLTANQPWSEHLEQQLRQGYFNSYRLSNSVAVVRQSEKSLLVEYKGRHLGAVKDNRVLMDNFDKEMSWVQADLATVNLRT